MTHLIISREYPPCSYPQGGIGTYVAHVARLLAERGETVHVIGEQWDGAAAASEELCDGRLIVHRVPLTAPLPFTARETRTEAQRVLDAMARSEYPMQAFAWQAALMAESLVETAGIECIEAQEYEAPLYYFLVRRAMGLGPAKRPPCFVHLHSPVQFILHHNDWGLARPADLTMKRHEDYVIQAADAALCPSRYLGRQVEEHYGLAPGSIERIPYPKGDTAEIERTAETWEHGTICYIGRLESRKGVLEWIEAVVAIARERPGLRFELIGADVPLTAKSQVMVREAVEALVPADVKVSVSMSKSIPRADLWARLAKARIAVVPSRWENFPNTCVEAMSTGLPVLASPDGGMAEMIDDGRTGWIADSVRPADLATALRRALDTPATTKAEMGRAAAAAIRRLCDNTETIDMQLQFRQRVIARGAHRSLSVPRAASSMIVSHDTSTSRRTTGGAPASRPAAPARCALESRRGVAIVVIDGAPGRVDECLASIRAQTTPATEVVHGLTDLRAMLDGSTPHPLGIAIVDTGCRVMPSFVAAIEATLCRNPSVGVVSAWSASEPGNTTLAIRPGPQRPYQWIQDDLAACCAFRTEALSDVAWILDVPGGGVGAPDIALAVLLAGWNGVTYPEALSGRILPTGELQLALADAARGRVLSALRSHFPQEVLLDGQEILSLSHGSRDGGGASHQRWLTPPQLLRESLRTQAHLAHLAFKDPRGALSFAFAQGRRVARGALRRLGQAHKTTSRS